MFSHDATLALASALDTKVAPVPEDTVTPVSSRAKPSTEPSNSKVASSPLPAASEEPVNENPNTIPFEALNVVSPKGESTSDKETPETANWNPPIAYSESYDTVAVVADVAATLTVIQLFEESESHVPQLSSVADPPQSPAQSCTQSFEVSSSHVPQLSV